MALFEATYSQIIIQNPAVSKGQPSCFWWWKELGSVWKEGFSTPWQRARVRLDHGQGCSIQETQQLSSRSWGQVNGNSLLTPACHQQLISQVCKWADTDLLVFFSPEMLTVEKQVRDYNCFQLIVTWKLYLWSKIISNPGKNCLLLSSKGCLWYILSTGTCF